MHGIFSMQDLPCKHLPEEGKVDILVQTIIKMQLLPDPIMLPGVVTSEGPMEVLAEDRLIIQPENYFWEAVAVQATRMITMEEVEETVVR